MKKIYIIFLILYLTLSSVFSQSFSSSKEEYFISQQSGNGKIPASDFLLGIEEWDEEFYLLAENLILNGVSRKNSYVKLINILNEKDRIQRDNIRDIRIGRINKSDSLYSCHFRIINNKSLPDQEGFLYFSFSSTDNQWLLEDMVIH